MRKVKVLFLGADPRGAAQGQRLGIDEEMRRIHEKIRAAEFRDALEFSSRWAVRADDLLQALNEVHPEVVHISGHGTETGEFIVVGRDGGPHPITAGALRSLFRTLKDRVRVVLLNFCHSDSQSAGINESIDCVVGMTSVISDEASIAFAAAFYGAIGFGRSVQDAFDQGITALQLEAIPEDYVPRLSVRRGVDPRNVILVSPTAFGPEQGAPAVRPAEDRPEAELVLLQIDDAAVFCRADSVTVRGDSVAMALRPSPADGAFLSTLTPGFGARRRLWVAFAESAFRGVAESVERTRAGGEERWSVTIAKEPDRGEPMEMSTAGTSADQIAELRARRILLDERPPSEASAWIRTDPTLEVLVKGLGETRVERSPLPPLYAGWTGSRTGFLSAARLAAVLWLHASHTVEHVLELSMAWSGDSAIDVRFHGRRRKVYTNRPAPEIRVEGICRLAS